MRTVDGYLSQRAGNTWAGAVVYKEPDDTYTLERPGEESVSLGNQFSRAQMALAALRDAARSRRRGDQG